MTDNIQKLQLWYRKQCDESWEHQYGVSIDTLDNPGWTVVIDLVDTDLQSMQMALIVEDRDEDDWLQLCFGTGLYSQ
jgi:hypothetical protein